MRKKQHAVLVADLSSPIDVERAQKAKTMIAHSNFREVRIVDIARIHSGFAVIDNDEIVERCFCLCSPEHPSVRLINGDIHWLSAADIDRAATMPDVVPGAMADRRAAMEDEEIEPLRKRFAVLSGKQPDRRWGKERLNKEIEAQDSVGGMTLE